MLLMMMMMALQVQDQLILSTLPLNLPLPLLMMTTNSLKPLREHLSYRTNHHHTLNPVCNKTTIWTTMMMMIL